MTQTVRIADRPTAIAYYGSFYIGNLNTLPVVPGSSKIYKIAQVVMSASSQTDVGSRWALYVFNVGFGPPPVGLGEILRITVP